MLAIDLRMPEWAGAVFLIALILGFPIAILFAWAYEITPDGVTREKNVQRDSSITHLTGRKLDLFIIGVLILAVVVMAYDKYAPHPQADRVFTNAAVYTVDSDRSWAEAIAILDGEIMFVGGNEQARAYIGEQTEVTDLNGAMMLPGFHDSHTHLLIGTTSEEECDLLRLETIAEVQAEFERCSQFKGLGDESWITGGGWAEWLWPDANPGKSELDEFFPDRPVYLSSSFGHAGWANTRALELAGISDETPNPPLGIIERDAQTGEASGTLRESAMSLVSDRVPPKPIEQKISDIRMAIGEAHSFGITAVIEPGMDEQQVLPLVKMADDNELNIRSLISLSPLGWIANAFDDEVYDFLEQRDQWRRPNLDVDSVKIYMDGVVEFGTASVIEPYEKAKFGHGLSYYEQEQLNEYMTRFDAMGLQIHIHAIGDAAVRMALNGYEAALQANGPTDNRHHMVHLQVIDETEIPRFGELNVSATFQSLWAYWDESVFAFSDPYLGAERIERTYPINSVHKAGGRIVGGSDYWVTDMNPLQAIEVAITRQNPYTNDGPVLNESERVDLATMIDAYTINGAYLMRLEDKQGSIEVGKRADLVVLDKNLFELPASEINEAVVLMTIFDGDTVYQRP
jgi:predicted amidohydrolase YtcJ